MNFWPINLKTPLVSGALCGVAFAVSGAEISEAELASLPPADIYILGEIHDNDLHHQRQALAVAGIKPTVLVFEMLSPAQAARGRDADRSDPEALAKALEWNDAGWEEITPWSPIFNAAPEAALYGAALPRDDVRSAVMSTAADVFGVDAARFGLTQALPVAEKSQRETLQDEVHCGALPPDILPGMVEAQRLRDAAFARTALQALRETGGPVAVITGNGHAKDWGMPAAFRIAAPETRVISIGQVTEDVEDPPYDLWITGSEVQRDSAPCAAFQSK